MKYCRRCQKNKSVSDFYLRSNNRLHSWCKSCCNINSVAWQKKRRIENPELVRAKRAIRKSEYKEPIIGHINCDQCGVSVPIHYPAQVGRRRFCSRKCKGKWFGPRNLNSVPAMLQAAFTPAALAKRKAAARRGKDHPNWIDGRTALQQRPRILNANWRKAVFLRDDFTCQLCGVRGVKLHADHIKPYALYPDLRWDVDNGRTLCIPCHKTTPTFAGKMRKFRLQLERKP